MAEPNLFSLAKGMTYFLESYGQKIVNVCETGSVD